MGVYILPGCWLLTPCSCNMDVEYYKKVLHYCLLSSSKHLYPNSKFIFMHDNAPILNAKKTKAFLEAEGVEVLPWPGQSPDLNPIETLWNFMKVKVKGKRLRNNDELLETQEKVWNDIPLTYIRKLIDSMQTGIWMVKSKIWEIHKILTFTLLTKISSALFCIFLLCNAFPTIFYLLHAVVFVKKINYEAF